VDLDNVAACLDPRDWQQIYHDNLRSTSPSVGPQTAAFAFYYQFELKVPTRPTSPSDLTYYKITYHSICAMLTNYFKATKSRKLPIAPRSPEDDQASKMDAQSETDTTVPATAPAPQATVIEASSSGRGTVSISDAERVPVMDTENESTVTPTAGIMARQTADGPLSATSIPNAADEAVSSPLASSLAANAPQDVQLSMPIDTGVSTSEITSTDAEVNAGDGDTAEVQGQHLAESGGAHNEVQAPQVGDGNESTVADMLATEASTDVIVRPTADMNIVSMDDMVLSAAQSSCKDTHRATDVNDNSEHKGCLCKYRPSTVIPSFQGRAKSVPAACGTHYSYVANWPPQDPPTCDYGRRLDVFPPKDAPLHVWIQAYALRWGVWSTEVKDDTKRAQLLEVVTEKMKAAWETAIVEGHYIRPRETIVDMTYARADGEGQDHQDKRGRKRAQSPTRLPAGFAHEGKDPYAVTNGELAQNQITMEMIRTRVQDNDYEAGELLLDDVLNGLPDGRERLVERDWSATYHPSVPGRNLLMYSLWAVQDARYNVLKLKNLMKHFTKEQQKKNTLSRIETYQEREAQHLALATELRLRQSNDLDAADEDNLETEPVDLTSEASSDEENSVNGTSAQTQGSNENVILELAREVVTANNEQGLLECFTTKELRGDDFAPGGNLTVDVNDKFKAAGALLGDIYRDIEHIIRFRNSMKGHQPSEMIKMGHDARLVNDRIDNSRAILRQTLKDDLQLDATDTLETRDNTRGSDDNDPVDGYELYQDAPEFSTDAGSNRDQFTTGMDVDSRPDSPPGVAVTTTTGAQHGLGINTDTNDQAQVPSTTSSVSPVAFNGTFSNNAPLQQAPNAASILQASAQMSQPGPNTALPPSQTDLKQAYINEQWIPFLKRALTERGLPPLNGMVSLWPQIKDILTQLGFTAEERNEQLRRFKAGFDAYVRKNSASQPIDASAHSPPLSINAPSPAQSHASLQNAPASSWPSDAEILKAIPPQGVHISHLIRLFDKRIGQYRPQFFQNVQRLALVSPQHVIHPRPSMPPTSRQYNTLPPSQAATPVAQSQNMSPSSPMLPPTQGRAVLKLKYPPRSSTSPTMTLQDDSQMPDEFKSTTVEGSRGFSFRHLPHATLEQRRRMDDHVGEYISKTAKARKKNPFGQYITFHDPNDPSGPVILHGFWENQNGSQPDGSEWFFNGEDVPADWDMTQGASDAASQGLHASGSSALGYQHSLETSDQAQPKLKLKFNTSTQAAAPTGQYNPQAGSNFNFQSAYSAPPGSPMVQHMPRGRARNTYQPSYGMGSIDPTQLLMPQNQSSLQAYAQGQGQAAGQGGVKKGTKRGGSGSRGGGKKKRRKTKLEFDDQDDSGDYDPGRD